MRIMISSIGLSCMAIDVDLELDHVQNVGQTMATVNVHVLQPRINTTTQRSRHRNVNSTRILEAVLTMVQQRYKTSGGAFQTRGLHTSLLRMFISLTT